MKECRSDADDEGPWGACLPYFELRAVCHVLASCGVAGLSLSLSGPNVNLRALTGLRVIPQYLNDTTRTEGRSKDIHTLFHYYILVVNLNAIDRAQQYGEKYGANA